MNIIDIIEKKRLNHELTKEELCFAFNGYLNKEVMDYQMSALLMTIMFNNLSEREIIDLTDIFINSGKTLDLSKYGISADKHSTGGVGDKVTLILGPILASCGVNFPKMSGRGLGYTGGTIDKLESIPGINLNLSATEIKNAIKNVGMAIVAQSQEFVPMDKIIYSLRSATSCVSSIALIAISIMSKKIAYGSDIIFIDVKCGKGALIHTKKDATELIRIMRVIANHYNKNIKAEITQMNNPLGDNIGNALEVIEAMDILNGKRNDLAELCKKIASEIIVRAKNISYKEAYNQVCDAIDRKLAIAKFYEFVKNQGGKLDKLKISDKIETVYSSHKGIIQAIDALEIAKLSFTLGAGRINKEDVIDYSVGIVLLKNVGDTVKVNDPIMNIYYSKNFNYPNIDKIFEIK